MEHVDDPLVSIITVNFNTTRDTIEFLESCYNQEYKNFEVIIVDNGSKPPLPDITYPNLTLIRLEKNRGFAGGNNVGIARAKGKYLYFLNSDTILFPNSIHSLVSFMECTPNAGMASPKVLYPDTSIVQYAGGLPISPYTGRGRQLGFLETDKGQYDRSYKTGWGHGAALMVPRNVIDKIGPMPEIYFLYYEEIDWAQRARDAGFDVYFVGTSKMIHKEAVSMGGNESTTKAYYMVRSRLLYMKRNSSGLTRIIGILFFLLGAAPKQAFDYIRKGKFHLLKAYVRGVNWNLFSQHH